MTLVGVSQRASPSCQDIYGLYVPVFCVSIDVDYNMVGDDTMHMICIMHGCSMH